VPEAVLLLLTAVPDEPSFDPDEVTPGLPGFLVTFAIVIAVVFLLRDFIRRVRRLQVRGQLLEQAEAERAGAERADAERAGAERADAERAEAERARAGRTGAAGGTPAGPPTGGPPAREESADPRRDDGTRGGP
jgi:hypothetical protein